MNAIMDSLTPFFRSLGSGIADFIYGWDEEIIGIVGLFMAAFPYIFALFLPKRKNSEVINKYAMGGFFLISLLIGVSLFFYIRYINDWYFRVPDLSLENCTIKEIRDEFEEIGLFPIFINFSDTAVNENDSENGKYNVIGIEPEVGELVKKDSTVIVSIKSTANEMGKGEEGGTELGIDVELNKLTIETGETGVKMVSRENEITVTSVLDVLPTEEVGMQVILYDYKTDGVVESYSGYLGEDVVFDNLINGEYYFEISADGYITNRFGYPIQFTRSGTENNSEIVYVASLEKNNVVYGDSFTIHVQNDRGDPICNTAVYIRTARSETDYYNDSYYTLFTDDDGYLSNYYETTVSEGDGAYSIINFSTSDGISVELSLVGGNSFYSVNIEGNIGVCRIPS